MKQDIPELTSLRFFAALAVVVSHVHGLGFADIPAVHHFLDGGRPAVAFFFTLSGFVLTLRYKPDNIDRGYFAARFARIYPVHLLGLAISAPTVLFVATNNPGLAESLFALKGHVSVLLVLSMMCQLLLLTAWTPVAGLNQPWNGPAWSLSCEAFFYILFPRLRRLFSDRPVYFLAAVVACAWVIQMLWINLVPIFAPANRAGFLVSQFPLPHLFEFVSGVVCGILYSRGQMQTLVPYWKLGALAAILCIVILSAFQPVQPAYSIQGPFFAVLISMIAIGSGIGFLRNKNLVLLGASSYSLYITHVPILLALKIAGFHWNAVIIISGLMFISVGVFWFFEEPLRRGCLTLFRKNFK